MDLALICVKQIAVMFILVGLGIICGKTDLIDKNTNTKLSGFVLEVVNPLLIFMSYQREFRAELLAGLGMAVLLAFASYGVMIVFLKFIYRKNSSDDGLVEQFAAIYSNCGFMGIPLINGIFGAEGVFYLTGYVTVFNIMVWTHGVIFFGGKEQKTSVKKVLTSPAIIGTGAGLLSFLARPLIPAAPAAVSACTGVLLSACQFVADMNTPLAMLCAGVTISGTVIGSYARDIGVYRAAALRLIVCPVLFWLVFRLLPVPKMVFMVVMTAAGCPAAATGTMFALRYNKLPEKAAVIFAATTLFSAVTLPLMVVLGGI